MPANIYNPKVTGVEEQYTEDGQPNRKLLLLAQFLNLSLFSDPEPVDCKDSISRNTLTPQHIYAVIFSHSFSRGAYDHLLGWPQIREKGCASLLLLA